MPTKNELVQQISDSDLVLSLKEMDPSSLADFTGFYRTRIRVLRAVQRGSDVAARSEDYEIVHKEDGSDARWYRSTPSVLRDQLSQRGPQLSQEKIRDLIESFNMDWQVLELQVNPRGNFDLVRATIDDLQNTFDKQYRVWKKQAEDWFLPDSTEAFPMGALKWHKDILWESEHDANVWEPGTQGAPWKEVDPVEIREVIRDE